MKELSSCFTDLSKLQLFGIGVALVIVLGVIGAAYSNNKSDILSGHCTQMACNCPDNPQDYPLDTIEVKNNTSSEIECNRCSESIDIFNIGVFSISRSCTDTQIYMCSEGEKVSEHYRDDGCEYRFNSVLS